MYLTGIKRHYYINKVCRKIKFKEKYLLMLYTIHLMQPCGYYVIDTTLKNVNRRHNGNMMKDYLKFLVNHNYVNKDHNKKYTLTPAGIALLKDIETKLIKERHDK